MHAYKNLTNITSQWFDLMGVGNKKSRKRISFSGFYVVWK